MGLREQLVADLRAAMRAKDIPARATIRMIRASVQNAEIALQREATDQEIIQLIQREAKRRNEAIELYAKAGRADLLAEEQAQMVTIERYLPKLLSREDIYTAVTTIANEIGATGMPQMGALMKQAMSQLKGKADGKLVNQVAREILSQ